MRVYDDYAYERGTARAIARNREIGKAKRREAKRAAFVAAPENAALVEAMRKWAAKDSFIGKMLYSFEDWGSLTEGQLAAAKAAVARREGWEAATEAKAAAQRTELGGRSAHVGKVGERVKLVAEVRKVFQLDSRAYGYGAASGYVPRWGHELVDIDGNLLAYFGTVRLGEEGEEVAFAATVKKHGEYNGIAQTVMTRPHMAA